MLDPQHRAIAAIALLAAVADGRTADAERSQIERTLRELSRSEPDLATLASEVMLGRATLEREAAQITDSALRRVAYENAICVCDSDGATSAEERRFLEQLRTALALPAEAARSVEIADSMVDQELGDEPADLLAGSSPPPPPPPLGGYRADAPKGIAATAAAEIDASIGRYAMLAGALELLPQTLATAGILPLQMKMVYSIGKAHGYALDRGHIKEFIGVVGAGLASQAVERVARNLVSGLAKRMLGRTLGSLGGVATGAAMSYATTWGLGQVAKSYYASGRTLTAEQLKTAFSRAVEQGKSMYERQAPQIAEQAKNLDVRKILGQGSIAG